jgi:DNA-binding response OmpR family regulator
MARASVEKVLLVDDDPDVRQAVALVLKLEGFVPELACNGQQALDALGRELPAVILLDMKMPVMDGWEFARQARARFGASLPPIIVLSAGENPSARAAEIGAQGWLGKPFEIEELRDEVRRQIDARQHS